MVKQEKYLSFWLPLEGKLAAQQADEVEHLKSPHPALRATISNWGKAE